MGVEQEVEGAGRERVERRRNTCGLLLLAFALTAVACDDDASGAGTYSYGDASVTYDGFGVDIDVQAIGPPNIAWGGPGGNRQQDHWGFGYWDGFKPFYVTDYTCNCILRVSVQMARDINRGNAFYLSRINSEVIAGDGKNGQSGYVDGVGLAARFSRPTGIAVDSQGNLFVADSGNNRIRKITPSGVVSTFAGGGPTTDELMGGASSGGQNLSGDLEFYKDGVGTKARFFSPMGVAIDGKDNLYVTDMGNSNIRKITPSGVVSTLAGPNTEATAGKEGHVDGWGSTARFKGPYGITFDKGTYGTDEIIPGRPVTNYLYVADSDNHRIRKITLDGNVSTVSGNGGKGHVAGTKHSAQFEYPFGIEIDVFGKLHVAEEDDIIRTIAQPEMGDVNAGTHIRELRDYRTNNGCSGLIVADAPRNYKPFFLGKVEDVANWEFTRHVQDSEGNWHEVWEYVNRPKLQEAWPFFFVASYETKRNKKKPLGFEFKRCYGVIPGW